MEPCEALDALCEPPGVLNWTKVVNMWLQPWDSGITLDLLDETEAAMRIFDPNRQTPPKQNPLPFVNSGESQWRVQVHP